MGIHHASSLSMLSRRSNVSSMSAARRLRYIMVESGDEATKCHTRCVVDTLCVRAMIPVGRGGGILDYPSGGFVSSPNAW